MAMTATYTTFGGAIVHEVRAGTERFYAPDTLGSTQTLHDATGAVTDTFDYWPYGETRSRTGTTDTPFTFVGTLGYFADSVTRLYVRARYYLDQLARWQTVDPLWPMAHAYAYALNNPTTYTDPTGNVPQKPGHQQPPKWSPPWLNPSDPRGPAARKCVSDALNSSKYCSGLDGDAKGYLYSMMLCIMGCETSGPGNIIPNHPFEPDDPDLALSKQGQGPCRLTRGWENLYVPNWQTEYCPNMRSGVNLLCYYASHPGQFGGKGQPQFPWQQDDDPSQQQCLSKCMAATYHGNHKKRGTWF